jgi:DNA-binding MarR family transcriptional regulator
VSHEDVLLALEQELTALWRQWRVSARDAARRVHPRLDPTAYPMVSVLSQSGPMRVSELGAALFLDKSTISRQVEAAVRLGVVERTVDPTDARARLVGLTETGRRNHEAVRDERRAQWNRALSSWDRADVVTLTELVAKLSEAGVG